MTRRAIHVKKALFIVGCAAVLLPALAGERKVGIIGIDTWHALEFSKLLNAADRKPEFAGFRVTHSYEWGSRDIASSLKEKENYRPELLKLGVKPVDSIAALLREVDCVLLETNDGRPHLAQAKEVFASGKPVFIDKPVADSWANVKAIYEAGRACGAKWYSSSGLRYQKALREAKAGNYGKVFAAHMYTPAWTDPTQHVYYWYGIHGAEPLYAAMGAGCVSVRCFGSENDDVLIGTWGDGRTGEVRMSRSEWGCGAALHDGSICTQKRGCVRTGDYEGYEGLLSRICAFFRTGVPPVSNEETLEIYAFMEAGLRSKGLGGASVGISEVLGGMPRAFVAIPSVAVASNGRLWCSWYAGPTPGEDENNYIVLATSADGGRTWTEVAVDDPDGTGPVHYGDPQVWIAPDGKLRWFAVRHEYDKSPDHPAQVVMTEFANATEANPPRAPQRRLMPGCMAVKPFVAPDGAWILPVCVWKDARSSKFYESTDALATWRVRGETGVADEAIRSSDETAVTAGKGKDWHAFIRTSKGLYEASSSNAGRTWTAAAPAKGVRHTPARLVCRTLRSGNVLLVKHGKIDEQCPRERLTAYLSTDGGRTWKGGLMLDERANVSYPDADQAADGTIYVAYDRDRVGAREINMAVFTEADVLAGKDVSGKVRLRVPVSRGKGRGILPPYYAGPVKGRYHSPATRGSVGRPQVVKTPGGRLWATWSAGQEVCDDHNTYVVLATSTDDGKTWREQLVVDPDFMWSRRAFAPSLSVRDDQLEWTWRDEVTWNWCSKDVVRPKAQLWRLTVPADADVSGRAASHYVGEIDWNAPDVAREESLINKPAKLDDITGKIWSFEVRPPERTDR